MDTAYNSSNSSKFLRTLHEGQTDKQETHVPPDKGLDHTCADVPRHIQRKLCLVGRTARENVNKESRVSFMSTRDVTGALIETEIDYNPQSVMG